MTLLEWEVLTGERSYQTEAGYDGMRYVTQPRDVPDDEFRQLWQLSDYLVSSVGSGVIWLSQKQGK